MAGLGEVAIDEVAAVVGVEATEGGVDGDGELATGGAGESPEKGDRQQLFFASGEAAFGEGFACGIEELEGEGVGVDLDLMHQIGFVEQVAEAFGDEGFQSMEFAVFEPFFELGKGRLDGGDGGEDMFGVFELDGELAKAEQFFTGLLQGLFDLVMLVFGLGKGGFELGDFGLGSANGLL